jgi:Sec-independent protein translocase protein TatA
MKISHEELEKIKQSHKTKDLKKIIHEEASKKEEEANLINNNEGDDKNFISNMTKNHPEKATDAKRRNIFKRLKNELGKVTKKLRNAVRPLHTELRSLDNEVGGLEVDYEEIDKKNDKDIDVWDNRTQKIQQGAEESYEQDQEENESFIHAVKTGIWRRKKGKKRKRSMGQVDLGEAAENSKSEGFIGRLFNQQLSNKNDNSILR